MRGPEKMIIYNLFPLLAGKFSGWGGHFERASRMGFNWIFVNPIQRTGNSGSLYSIADYFDFNPLFIDEDGALSPEGQVREMVKAADRLGLNVMIDLVINHCSVDSPLVQERPAWFQWKKSGKVDNPFAMDNGKKVVWKDLAKIDYRHTRDREGLYRYFSDVVRFLIDLGFKGFRCDAAYQVPRDFWERLIRETKKDHRGVRFFAETLGCTPEQTRKTASAGFDYIFNSSKWWNFKGHWLMEQYALTRDIAPSISFPESHDTERLCEELGGNVQALKQRYLFAALFSGGVMMPMGFEYGFRKHLHVVKTRPGDWEKTSIDLTDFITRVNGIKAGHPIFQGDVATQFLGDHNPNVLVMWKACTSSREEALVLINKDANGRQRFEAESLQGLLQGHAGLSDVSPETTLEHIPKPFSCDLSPGQGMVFITSREEPED